MSKSLKWRDTFADIWLINAISFVVFVPWFIVLIVVVPTGLYCLVTLAILALGSKPDPTLGYWGLICPPVLIVLVLLAVASGNLCSNARVRSSWLVFLLLAFSAMCLVLAFVAFGAVPLLGFWEMLQRMLYEAHWSWVPSWALREERFRSFGDLGYNWDGGQLVSRVLLIDMFVAAPLTALAWLFATPNDVPSKAKAAASRRKIPGGR